jgi:hypothetical protein
MSICRKFHHTIGIATAILSRVRYPRALVLGKRAAGEVGAHAAPQRAAAPHLVRGFVAFPGSVFEVPIPKGSRSVPYSSYGYGICANRLRLTNLDEAILKPHQAQSLCAEDSPWLPNSQLVTRSIKRSAITPKERSSRYLRIGRVIADMRLNCPVTGQYRLQAKRIE